MIWFRVAASAIRLVALCAVAVVVMALAGIIIAWRQVRS